MFDQSVCSQLWEKISLQTRNLVPVTSAPKGVVQLIGFADLVLFIGDIPLIFLPKTALKLIRGRLHFDPQVVEGKGDKTGEYFPTWRPSTAEARVVLEELLKTIPEVQSLVEAAVAKNKESNHA